MMLHEVPSPTKSFKTSMFPTRSLTLHQKKGCSELWQCLPRTVCRATFFLTWPI